MKRALSLFFLVAASGMLLTCTGSPAAPGGTSPPNQSQYEAVPTERHYLMDDAGKKTHMWARLLAEPIPPRGSTITLGSGACPAGCFHGLQLEFGVDPLPNPYVGVTYIGGFSQDGSTISTSFFGAISVTPGSTSLTSPNSYQFFSEKPGYLALKGSFSGDTNGSYGTFPGESGTANFVLDYK